MKRDTIWALSVLLIVMQGAFTMTAFGGSACSVFPLQASGDHLSVAIPAAQFAGIGGIDAGHVVASRERDVVVDPATGDSRTAGDLVLAWEESDLSLAATRGAFVIWQDALKNFLGGFYFGQLPQGPPAEQGVCEGVCQSLDAGWYRHYGAGGLAFKDGRLFFTGWTRPSATEMAPAHDKDLFIAELTADLTNLAWSFTEAETGDAEGFAVLPTVDDHVLVTGYRGEGRDVFLSKIDGSRGRLTRRVTAGGPWDDEGRGLAFDGNEVVLEGRFTKRLDFGSDQLEEPGQDQSGFLARYDANLNLLSTELLNLSPRPCAFERPDHQRPIRQGELRAPTGTDVGLTDLQISGGWGSGGLAQLNASDDCSLHLYEHDLGDGAMGAFLFATLVFDPAALLLDVILLEIESATCVTVTTALGGGLYGEALIPLGAQLLCPLAESVLAIRVPTGVSEALGIADSEVLSGQKPVLLAVGLQFHSSPIPCPGNCQTTAKDVSIDKITIKSDYDR